MDLLRRYLQAVGTYLPKSQQDDILKELGENLRSQMEDKEAELGRPLNEDEVAAILKKHGHPMFVAAHYRQTRHLIGSTLFPVYWFVMKIILGIVGFGYSVSALVLIAQGKGILEVLGTIFSYAGAVLPTFGWVTIIFAVLDIGNNKFHLLEKATRESNDKFDPRTLPALRPASDSPDSKPIPRHKTAVELFFSVAFLLWWIRVSPIRKLALFMALGPVGLADKIPFQLGPVWETVYWPVILLTLVAVVQQIAILIHPDRIKFYRAMRVISSGGSVIVLYLLSRADGIFMLTPGVADAAKFAETLRIVNITLHYTMFFTAIMTAVECFKQIRLLFRGRRHARIAVSSSM
ncbi:MAG TPA: hypothetical protein VF394_02920 [Candidatus Acidoferrum sp.]